jgi:hypothetical protein
MAKGKQRKSRKGEYRHPTNRSLSKKCASEIHIATKATDQRKA